MLLDSHIAIYLSSYPLFLKKYQHLHETYGSIQSKHSAFKTLNFIILSQKAKNVLLFSFKKSYFYKIISTFLKIT